MRLIGIEPTHAAPEATALSTELQALNKRKNLPDSTLYTIAVFGTDFK